VGAYKFQNIMDSARATKATYIDLSTNDQLLIQNALPIFRTHTSKNKGMKSLTSLFHKVD
jgi:hypothetical protein